MNWPVGPRSILIGLGLCELAIGLAVSVYVLIEMILANSSSQAKPSISRIFYGIIGAGTMLRQGTSSPGCLTVPWAIAAMLSWIMLATSIWWLWLDRSILPLIVGTVMIVGPPAFIILALSMWLWFYFWPPHRLK